MLLIGFSKQETKKKGTGNSENHYRQALVSLVITFGGNCFTFYVMSSKYSQYTFLIFSAVSRYIKTMLMKYFLFSFLTTEWFQPFFVISFLFMFFLRKSASNIFEYLEFQALTNALPFLNLLTTNVSII